MYYNMALYAYIDAITKEENNADFILERIMRTFVDKKYIPQQGDHVWNDLRYEMSLCSAVEMSEFMNYLLVSIGNNT